MDDRAGEGKLMNGYLVVLRCIADELPILLTSDLAQALEVAATVTPECKAAKVVAALTVKMQPSAECSVAIWTFEDGVLVKSETVKEFD